MIDLTFVPKRKTTTEEVNDAIRKAATSGPLKGILGISDGPLVSHDFNHDPRSSILDSQETQVLDGEFVRVLSWYDNEWGFSNRMLDTAAAMGRLG
jgi:glyceraldehyde 3-phosphate dehydrogenase